MDYFDNELCILKITNINAVKYNMIPINVIIGVNIIKFFKLYDKYIFFYSLY
jgi:hypothetical protein